MIPSLIDFWNNMHLFGKLFLILGFIFVIIGIFVPMLFELFSKYKNKKHNEGICKCGHKSEDHSFNPYNEEYMLDCDIKDCDCTDYKFDRFEGEY